MTERRIQEILDSNTEHIPESLYIQLSNEVMRLHNRPTSFGDEVELLEFQTSLLNVALRDANVRERSLRRQLHDIRHGGELARVKEELEVRKKVNADSVAMYKSQITAQCAKIVEYKSKIRELTEKLKSPVEIPRQVEVPPQQPVEIPRPVEVPPQQPVARPPNPWLTHLKEWVKNNNTTYAIALKDPRCKESYWATKRTTTPN